MSKRHRREPEFRSYYEQPILNRPEWHALDVAGYLFLGGLAGASGVIGAAARLSGRRRLSRACSLASAAAGQTSLVLLVRDLGRPARFLNMLRVVKVTSPMSIGSWLLSGFVPLTDLAAAGAMLQRMPKLTTLASVGAGALGAPVSTYTAALIGNTAVPAWHEGHRVLPVVFASSALAAGSGVGLLAAPVAETGPLLPLGALAGVVEVGAMRAMRQQAGIAGEAYESGKAHELLRVAEGLTLGGAVLAVLARRSRLVRILAGAALMAGSALTRFGIFHAGMASIDDPKYTVVPQRERLARAASQSQQSNSAPA